MCHCLHKCSKYGKNNKNIPTGAERVKEIVPNVANETEKASLDFENYMIKYNILQPEHTLSVIKLKHAAFFATYEENSRI